MRKVLSRSIVLVACSAIALALCLAGLAVVRENARAAALADTEASFRSIVDLVAEGINSGYFQWTELRDLAVSGDEAQVAVYMKEITSNFRYARAAEVASGTPPPRPFRAVGDGARLVLEFPVTDSNGQGALPDRVGRVALDAQAILAAVQTSHPFTLDQSGTAFVYGLRGHFDAAGVSWADALVIGVIVLLVVGILLVAFWREDRFFYEAKGLDTIIFLFEHTERYSANHSRTVAEIATGLGRGLGLRGRRLKDLRTAALLHDIGKIAVPRDILVKPGVLTKEEYTTMRTHAEASGQILEYFDELAHLAPIVRSHHEKLDGTGYPDGLKGEHIPLESRIITVADIFEALTGERPYRSPFLQAQAVAELRGMAIDQAVVDALEVYLERRAGVDSLYERKV